MLKIFAVLFALLLSACAAPAKYSALPETGATLKQAVSGNVSVGAIKAPASFNSLCRLQSFITTPDYSSFEGYIQNALIEELKAAGKYDDKVAKVTLSGAIDELSFSTTTHGLTGGTWDIKLRVTSSNGKTSVVSEHHEYETSMIAAIACQRATDAYFPAVQNLIGKLVKSDEFKALVTP